MVVINHQEVKRYEIVEVPVDVHHDGNIRMYTGKREIGTTVVTIYEEGRSHPIFEDYDASGDLVSETLTILYNLG